MDSPRQSTVIALLAAAVVGLGVPAVALAAGAVPSVSVGPAAVVDTTDRTPAGTDAGEDGPPNGTAGNGSVDSDGDGFTDAEERRGETDGGMALPGSDPGRPDIYLTVLIAAGEEPLTERERADLREIWAGMPVSGPNGTGIRLHVTQRQLDRPYIFDGTEGSFRDMRRAVYDFEHPCGRYVALGADGKNAIYVGRGATPGYFSVFDAGDTGYYGREYSVRVTSLTHELLHNVVGEFPDGSTHTAVGWLAEGNAEFGTGLRVSDRTAAHLSVNGFDESAFYERRCG